MCIKCGIDTANNEDKITRLVSILLIAYVYAPYFWNICENMFKWNSITEYIFLLSLSLISIFIYHKIDVRVFLFLFIFVVAIVINGIAVSYSYYVFVEGMQALIGILVPCICITNYKFKISDFLNRWYKFSYLNIPLVIVAVPLLRAKLINYSIFTGICVPNVFILAYGIMQMSIKKKWALLVSLFNIMVTATLGGRMAAVVCIAMLIIAYLFSKKIGIIRKILFMTIVFIMTYFVLGNINEILLWANQILVNYGIRSRSITLLIEQLATGELYTTNRDMIYSLVINYIKDRAALPGGFGVALYLTSGEFYYVHNVLLQLLVVFGAPGTVVIMIISIFKVLKYHATISNNAMKLLGLMFISYLLIGFTGSSFFIHFLATIFIVLFYFGENVLVDMEF